MHFIILSILFYFVNINNNVCHPIHLSVINMEYNTERQAFDISMKFFTDDFEKIINKNYNINLNLGKENQMAACNKYIDKYIKTNFKVFFNKKKTEKELKLKEFVVKNSDNAVWVYYSLKSNKPKTVRITNTLLNDLYKDQKNLFIFTFKKIQEAKKFERNDSDLQFVLK